MKKSFLFLILLILMLFHPDYVTEGAKNGLLLWYGSVVPALFPFMVISGLLEAGDGLKRIMTPFFLLLHPLLGLSHDGCYVLVSGFLCGYPMGAKTCADFLREGRLTTAEAKFLMAISNHPSPMFLLGFVYPLLKPSVTLTQFLAAVYGPVAVLAIAAKLCYFHKKNIPASGRNERTFSETPGSIKTTDETILNAIEILCKIGGYLVLFSIVIVFLLQADGLPDLLKIFLIASMEMTTGVKEAAKLLSFPYSGAAVCGALTFGGFSGLFQTKAVISSNKNSTGLSIRHYLIWKLCHAGLSFGMFLLLSDLSF